MKASPYLTQEHIEQHQLNTLPMFKHTDPHYLEQLFSVCKVEEFEPEEVILEQGKVSNWFFILLNGKLSFRMNNMELTVLFKRGDVFSESALLDRQPSQISVAALEKSTILALDAVLLEDFHAPGETKFFMHFYKFLASVMSYRLSAVSTELALVKSVTHRLANQ